VLRLAYALTCTLTLLVAIGFVAYDAHFGARDLQNGNYLGPLFVIAAVGWTVFSLQDAALTALRGAHWVPLENAIFGVAKLVLLLAFAASGTAMGVFAPWVIGAIASLVPINILIFGRLIHRAPSERSEVIAMPEATRFVGPDYLASLCNYAAAALVPVLMLKWVGAVETAYFGLAWTSALTVDLLAQNMATALTVEGARDRERLPELLRSALRHTIAFMVPLTVLVVFVAPWALSAFGSHYASQGVGVLRLMGLACLPRALNNLAVGVLRVERRTHWITAISSVVCALTIGTGALLVHHIGIGAPALGWLVGQLVVAVFTIRFMVRRILHQEHLGKDPAHVARG
jgi:O-antigen/teichoic acid export membrane protein